ncbi:MAG: hypothetical protein KC589_09175 [Nanoarchaeota archaeon]|nr:hypothetical protein [Nanoarchaeota archaeon]
MAVNLDFTGNTQDLVDGLNKARVSMSDLNEETKQFDEASKDAFKQGSKSADEFGKAVNDSGKQQKEQIGLISELGKQLDSLKAKQKASFDKKELAQFNKEIQETEKELQRLGNIGKEGFDELGNAIEDSGSKFGSLLEIAGGFGLALGVGAIIDGVISIGAAVIDTVSQFRELRGEVQTLTGATGEELDFIVEKSQSLATVFDQDVGEVIKSANTLAKEFGLTQEEALAKLESGFLGVAGDTGELIEQVKEYSSQIVAAGGSADDLFSIVNKSTQEGIFSDKGIDVVKEFGLRIREQTTATSDALNNAFGEEFTNKIFKGINDGSLSSVDALKLVSEQMNDTSIPASQLQTVIADVFGGAGEDAGLKYLQSLNEIGGSVEDLIDKTNVLTQQQIASLEAEQRLSEAQNNLSKLFDDQSGNTFFTQLKALGYELLIGILEPILGLFKTLQEAFSPLIDALSDLGETIFGAGESFSFLEIALTPVKIVFEVLGFVLGLIAEAFTFVVEEINEFIQSSPLLTSAIQFIKDAFNRAIETFKVFKDLLSSGFDTVEAAGKTAARNLKENFTDPFIKQVNEIDKAQRDRLKAQLLRDQEEILSRLRVLEANGEIYTIEGQQLLEKAKAQNTVLQEIKKLEKEESEARKKEQEARLKAEEEAEAKRNDLAKKSAEERNKDAEKYAKERLKLEQDLQKSLDKLLADSQKSELDALTGEDKINAVKENSLKQIQALEDEIVAKGKLLDKDFQLNEDQQKQLQILRDATNQKALNDIAKFNADKRKQELADGQKSLDIQEKIDLNEIALLEDDTIRASKLEEIKQEAVLNVQRDYAQKRLDLLEGVSGKEAELQRLELQKNIQSLDKQLADLDAEKDKFSLKNLLGVTDEEAEGIKVALNEISNAVVSAVQDSIAEQLEANQQLQDAINERIDETEEALDREVELNKQGFASNVQAKQQELAELKKQREKAQQEEATLRKRQLALDTVTQLSSLITSSANLFKSLSTVPFGLGVPIAIGLTATMFAAFAAAKIKAFQSINQQAKLEKGGTGDTTGMIKGKRHSAGGERFIDHIEVEDGERWSVFNRSASRKNGRLITDFTDMVNSGDKRIDLIDDLLSGTGVLRSGIDKKIDNKKETIIKRERMFIASITSKEMINHLRSVDENLYLLVKDKLETPKRWEDDNFRYEKIGNKTKKIRKNDR